MATANNPNNLPVMEFDAATGEYSWRDWTDQERADNFLREQAQQNKEQP